MKSSGVALPSVVLYTRQDCHLCEEAKRALESVSRSLAIHVEEVDVDQHAFLKKGYSDEVPVVWIRGIKICKYRVDERMLLRRLRSLAPEDKEKRKQGPSKRVPPPKF